MAPYAPDDVLQQSANRRRNHGSTPVQNAVIVDEFRQVNPIALEAFFFFFWGAMMRVAMSFNSFNTGFGTIGSKLVTR